MTATAHPCHGLLIGLRIAIIATGPPLRQLRLLRADSPPSVTIRLDAETCERLFGVGGRVAGEAMIASEASERLDRRLEAEQQAVLARIAERNGRFFCRRDGDAGAAGPTTLFFTIRWRVE
jgi:hypothetical protein